MASSKIECLWQLISTNNFKEDIPEKYHCILCHNVTIEPFTALCECKFCFLCIKEYLKDGRKHCPGIKNDCGEEYLEIEVNVSRDIRTIRKIGRTTVKCPNEICEVRCELENMNEHLRVCGMSKTSCPYENIGCQIRQIYKENVKTHYDNEWFSHTKLLVEAIDNLRNDVEELKKVVERRDEEINKLNENSTIREITIKEMRIDIDTLKEINESKNIEMEEMKEEFRMTIETQNKTMLEEFENVKKDIVERDFRKNILINEIKQQGDDQRKDIGELKIKDERRDREMEVMKETQQNTMMEELENVRKDIVERDFNKSTQQKTMMEELENVKRDIVERDVRGDIEDQRKSLNDLRENQKNIEREINSVVIKVRDARIFDEREFIWRVNHFSKMRKDGRWRRVILWRYSLKLRLYLQCYKDYLGFYCSILKGEFDDVLEWPMKHKITLSLINQATMKSHKSVEYRRDSFEGDKSVFDRPESDFGNRFGENNFVTIKGITNIWGLLSDDSFVVSLNINYN